VRKQSSLPAGSDGARFREEVERHWLHRLHEFKPELVLISAGFDAHAEDDMSHVRLREPDYIWITRELKKVADTYGEGRIVSTLEGGYNLSALGRSAVAHIDALLGH
jgi:acetoin utilization deacetylase AcuC-like enzyme